MISDELFITCARALTGAPDRYSNNLVRSIAADDIDLGRFRAALDLAYQAGAASVSGCACGHHHAGKPCDGNECTCTSYLAAHRA